MNKFKKQIRAIENQVVAQIDAVKKSDLVKYVEANPYTSLGGVLVLFAIISILLQRKKTDEGENTLEKICEAVGLVHQEKTDIPVKDSNGQQKLDEHGRKMYVINKFVPEFNFSDLPNSFTISKVHKAVVSNLYNYINGLLTKLKEAGIIENGAGNISPTGMPGEFVINLFDKKKLDEIAMFKRIQWYREETINGIKKDYFPELSFNGDELVATLPKELNLTDEIIRRGIESVEKFHNISLKPKFEVSKDGRHIFFKLKPKLVQYFAKTHISASFELWMEKIIGPMRKFWDDNLIEAFCFGENIDKTVTLDENIIVETMANAPHILNFGATRSGKTKSCSSLIVSLMMAYPEAKCYFADGKKSADYVELAKRFSPLPLAGLPPEQDSDDPLIELANVVKAVYDEYISRVHLFQSVKEKYPVCSTYQDFNKYVRDDNDLTEEEKNALYMHRVFLVLDEWGLFMKASVIDPNKLANIKTSIFWMLNAIARAGASYGLSIILNTQRYQLTDMTSEMRSQLVVWLIHQLGLSDASGIGLRDHISDLKPGQFLLKSPGIKCKDTGKEFIKCTLPYIGDGQQFQELLDKHFPKIHPDKKEFDYSLIYAQQDEESFDKLKPETIQKYIKQVFLVREGYTILWEKPARTNFICLRADDPRTGKKYAIGILEYEEIADVEFLKRLNKESFPELRDCTKLFFLTGRVSGKVMDVQTNIASFIGETYLLSPLDYKRNMLVAIDEYNEKKKTPLFERCFDYKIDHSLADDLYREEEGNEKEDKVINPKTLEALTQIEDTNEKGKAFEKWFKAFERKLGYDTVTVDDLKRDGLVPTNFFANPQADGGIDLVRFIGPREEKRIIAIQCKNQISKNIDPKILSRAISSRELYESFGFTVEEYLIVSTGFFTKQCYNEAERYKVRLINRTQLDVMVEEFYGKTVQGAIDKALEEFSNKDEVSVIKGFGDNLGFDDDYLEEIEDDEDEWLEEFDSSSRDEDDFFLKDPQEE